MMTPDELEAPWSALSHPLVRNLAWCIFSPSLVQNQCSVDDAGAAFQIYEPRISRADRTFLLALDESPEPLQQWLKSSHTTRLGFQFEYYWQFWWRYRQASQEHRFNVQLTESGKTLGELDAVSWNSETGLLTHSEMAVKFYLGIDSQKLPVEKRSENRFSWVGPNVIDRLDLKWQQLSRRQLQHLHKGEIHNVDFLPEHWVYSQLQTQLIMRGRLFYPLGMAPDWGDVGSNGAEASYSLAEASSPRAEASSPWAEAPYINTHHLHGSWMTQSQFSKQLALGFTECDGLASSVRWMILRRDQWFAPVQLNEMSMSQPDGTLRQTAGPDLGNRALNLGHQNLNDSDHVLNKLAEHFSAYCQPIQVAALTQSGALWQECQRVFVVPDQWPATT